MPVPKPYRITKHSGDLPPGAVEVSISSSPWANPFKLTCHGGEWYVVCSWPSGAESLAAGPFDGSWPALCESLRMFEKYGRAKLANDPTWLDPLRDVEYLASRDVINPEFLYHRDILIKIMQEMERMA